MKLQKMFLCLACLALMVVVGCDQAKGRQAVTGKVTCNGVTPDAGSINFMPQAGTEGPSAGASIKDGVYMIEAKRGLMPGEYDVEIKASTQELGTYIDASGQEAQDMMDTSILPKKYDRMNGGTEKITATVVKGKNTIDFDLND